jgi:signal transduction histidine kinase/ActR/RegA family two-component response regulator
MTRIAQSRWFPYLLPLLSVAIATLVRLCLPMLGNKVLYITFFPAVVVSSLYGGVRGGVLAALLSAFAASFWLPPFNRPWIEKPLDILSVSLFFMVDALLISLCEGMRRARSRAEQAMHSQEQATQQVTRILDSITDGFAGLEQNGNCTYINAQGAAIFNQRPENMLGRILWETLPPGENNPFESTSYQAIAERRVIQSEEFYAPLQKWIRINAYPSGAGVSLFFQDVTQNRRAIDERLQLLEQERLARQEAETANRLKDEFLSTLSHELRTPLNAILGWSSLLRRTQIEPEQMEQGLQTIERNARSQARIIEDILDMSRIISGKLRLDVQQVALDEIISSAIDTIQPAAEARDIRIERLLDPLANRIKGDPDRLQQVVWNLLNNAVKFTPKGGKVQVSLERVNSHVEITVSDTGQGIAPEFLPHVFERFRQADSSSTRSKGGLGLGLSIVKHLVELHGGAVRAKSRGVGQGATFVVELPVMAVHHNEERREHPTTPTAMPPELALPELQGIRLLVVDDALDARELIEHILKIAGAEVVTAASASEAMQLLTNSEFCPHVILSDIGMPVEDGYQLMQQVRQLPAEQGGRTPAIALTAFARSEDRTRALRAGYQAHVAKPVEPGELLAVIASLADYK